VRGNLTYTLDVTDIRNIESDAASSIQDDDGLHLKSSIAPMIRYDSRDSLFNAKEGSLHSIEYELAGLGGDVGFNKITVDTGWYFPVWKLVFVPHARAGWMKGIPTYDVPDYEKFYLGGINSVRGGDRNDLAPKQDGEPVGGESFLQGNFEIKFPLVEEAGVFGILFVDAGSVYRTDFETDFGNAVVTVGPEIRWLSPIGPIRLAYGYYLTQKSDYKSSGGFEFSMASAF
jgi:outer membrane protein insertion porin family